LAGVRLDSGDLAYLSIEARKLLDAAGFTDTAIVASNDLDEHLIESLKAQGASIAVWGVGTRLVTAYDQPALGGVYKLSALRDADGAWRPVVKLSEQSVKINNPGVLGVRRYRSADGFVGDAIYDTTRPPADDQPVTIVDPVDPTRRKRFKPDLRHEELLVPIFRRGERCYDPPPLADVRTRTRQQLAQLHPTVRRFTNPHHYPVGLERMLYEKKTQLILERKALNE
ncbi:MAG: nicotinate phosphoribosyltransferase, partial [Catalinimonas sp.]